MVQGRPLPFAEYVFTTAHALMPVGSKDRDQAFALHHLQPSQTLTSFDGTFAIYRLTDVEAAHKPNSLDEVAAQVEADVKKKLAYEAALSDARKLIDAAKSSNLSSAAAAAGKLVVDSGEIRLGRPTEIEGLAISPQSQRAFTLQAFDLLAPVQNDQPTVGLIELPLDGRLLVAELRDVRSDLPAELLAAIESEIATRSTAQLLQQFAPAWFSYESVVERTGFKDLYAKTDDVDESSQ
jgi:hypothetical protein